MPELIARRAPEGHPKHTGPIIHVQTVETTAAGHEVHELVERIDYSGTTAEQALIEHGYTPQGEWTAEGEPGTIERLHLTRTPRYSTPARIETAIREAIGTGTNSKTPAEFHAYLDRRVAFCLESAANTIEAAQKVLDTGGTGDHVRDLSEEAAEFYTEARYIDAMRIKPVLS
ncbi:hypothetical protein [Nocardia yamanashiensis]|uniref:hypothetical protein n=1 Tax=Nocardia yamanashiensis TaxID=209247 RepID=UPI000835FAE9|nr:hypothetical protein [Nocardia yamanashiensis]